jgi:hypothetical protein
MMCIICFYYCVEKLHACNEIIPNLVAKLCRNVYLLFIDFTGIPWAY